MWYERYKRLEKAFGRAPINMEDEWGYFEFVKHYMKNYGFAVVEPMFVLEANGFDWKCTAEQIGEVLESMSEESDVGTSVAVQVTNWESIKLSSVSDFQVFSPQVIVYDRNKYECLVVENLTDAPYRKMSLRDDMTGCWHVLVEKLEPPRG